jgi:hypothetical protein
LSKGIRLSTYSGELGNHLGSIVPHLIRWNRQLWFAKVPNGPEWREKLAYRLGASWLNVAPVAYPDEVIDATWFGSRQRFDPAKSAGRILVRIAQDHSVGELLVQDHDEAMARELVFSTWIRRRDAHPLNRAYVDGVPIFFDHHIAFDGEPVNLPIETFFRTGPDAGHAGRWRLGQLPNGETPTTKGERIASGGEFAIHRIRNSAKFKQHVRRAVRRIRGFKDSDLREHLERARVTDVSRIGTLLISTRDQLGPNIEWLLRVLSGDEA